jgi:hypothetical protein
VAPSLCAHYIQTKLSNPEINGLLVSVIALHATGMAVGFVWLLIFGLGYTLTGLGRAKFLANAIQCTLTQLPELHKVLLAYQAGLPPVKVNLLGGQSRAHSSAA